VSARLVGMTNPTDTRPSFSSNRRLWAMASRLGHGFTLSGGDANTIPSRDGSAPDFNLPFTEFDAACAALNAARNDDWPSISCWPRLPTGEARHWTGSHRTRITISMNGDVRIETRDSGFNHCFDWGSGKPTPAEKPDGVITIRGREVTVTGEPSLTANGLLRSISVIENWPLDPEHVSGWLLGLAKATTVEAEAARWRLLARVVDDARVVLPSQKLLVRYDEIDATVTAHIRSLPIASIILAAAEGQLSRDAMHAAILAKVR
jgi:hypothetical protein